MPTSPQSPFFQQPPQLENQYSSDSLLKNYLEFSLPQEHRAFIQKDLERFGARVAGEMLELAKAAEKYPPELISFDAWGNRIDQLKFSAGWLALEKIAAEEKLISIAYERKQKSFSRLYQFAKLFLFHPSSAFVSCPLAMTDGAAKALELCGIPQNLSHVFKHLTSSEEGEFWTSGQWMTERTGGSDVSDTSSVARASGQGYVLSGDKWFSSGTGSQVALALARIEGDPAGSKGLSLFCVELRDDNQRLRNIKINRLKDKLGTKALPTAELTLEATPATLLGERCQGIKTVAGMLNVTRLYNSVCAVASTARGLSLVRSYSEKRKVFGKNLKEQPLFLQVLSDLSAQYEACFHLTFFMAKLLGQDEVGEISEQDRALLRLFTPITKLFTAKMAVLHASEILESFGGAGYIEDTGIPKILRDAQVFSIWEGTTNVLSLDVLRVLSKKESLLSFQDFISKTLTEIQSPKLFASVENTRTRV